MKFKKLQFNHHHYQRGISLLTTIIMLVMLMVIGVSAMRLSKQQLSLSGNLQFQTAAFNEAEAAIAVAENAIATTAAYKTAGIIVPAMGLYPISATPVDPTTLAWTSSDSLQAANSNQRYIIQQLAKDVKFNDAEKGNNPSAACNQVKLYRVTARGESARGASKFVQTVFSVLSC